MLAQVFNAKDTAGAIRAKLGELKSADNVIEAKIKQVNIFMYIAIALAVILGFAGFVMSSGTGTPAGCIVCVVFSALFLVPILIYRAALVGQDLENRKIETAQELFAVIGQDIPEKASCSLDVYFQGYLKHGKLVNKKSEGFFGSVRLYEYSDEWFSASGRLHDGNSFKIDIEQSAKRKEKSKRKYTKVNEILSERVKLALRIDEKTYPNFAVITQNLVPGVSVGDLLIQKVDLVEKTIRVIATTPRMNIIKGRYGTSKTGEGCLMSGKKLVGLFVHIYSHLQRCK